MLVVLLAFSTTMIFHLVWGNFFIKPIDTVLIIQDGKNNLSKGYEIWFKVYGVDELKFKSKNLIKREDGLYILNGNTSFVNISGKYSPNAKIIFYKNEYSGSATIDCSGNKHEIDFYAKQSSEKEVLINELLKIDIKDKILYIFIFLFLLIFINQLYNLTNFCHKSLHESSKKWTNVQITLFLSVGPLLLFTLSQMIFFPGQFSPDSISMLEPITLGERYSDAYSHLFIMLMRSLYFIFPDTSALVFSQSLLLSISIGGVLKEFYKRGIGSKTSLFWASMTIGAFPAIFLLSSTFWRDITYAALILFLVQWLLFYERKKWVVNTFGYFQLFTLLLLIPLIRLNGLVVIVLIVALLVFIGRKYKNIILVKKSFYILIIILISFFWLKPILYDYMGVAPMNKRYNAIFSVHLIGAMVSNDVYLSDYQEKLISSVMPLSEWKKNYDGGTVVPLFWNSNIIQYPLDKKYNEFNKLALKLLVKNPKIFIKHQMDVTSLLWRITPRKTDCIEVSPMAIAQLEGYPPGLTPVQQNIISEKIRNNILLFVREYVTNNPFFGRPALLMYFSMFIAIFMYRVNIVPMIILFPAFANTISLSILMSSQDYRYQFPIVLSSLLVIIYVILVLILHLGRGKDAE